MVRLAACKHTRCPHLLPPSRRRAISKDDLFSAPVSLLCALVNPLSPYLPSRHINSWTLDRDNQEYWLRCLALSPLIDVSHVVSSLNCLVSRARAWDPVPLGLTRRPRPGVISIAGDGGEGVEPREAERWVDVSSAGSNNLIGWCGGL